MHMPIFLSGSSVLTDGTPPRVVAKCSDDGAICETHQVVSYTRKDFVIVSFLILIWVTY